MYPKEVIYKKHMVAERYHTICGEWLSGDGSMSFPHKCSCGVWRYNWTNSTMALYPKQEKEIT